MCSAPSLSLFHPHFLRFNFRCMNIIRLHATKVYKNTHLASTKRNGMQTLEWKFPTFNLLFISRKISVPISQLLSNLTFAVGAALSNSVSIKCMANVSERDCLNDDGCEYSVYVLCVYILAKGKIGFAPFAFHFHVQSHARIVEVNITQRIYVIWLFQ